MCVLIRTSERDSNTQWIPPNNKTTSTSTFRYSIYSYRIHNAHTIDANSSLAHMILIHVPIVLLVDTCRSATLCETERKIEYGEKTTEKTHVHLNSNNCCRSKSVKEEKRKKRNIIIVSFSTGMCAVRHISLIHRKHRYITIHILYYYQKRFVEVGNVRWFCANGSIVCA